MFSVEAACADRKLRSAKGLPRGGEELATQAPQLNLPIDFGVAFEGMGGPRQLECPCLSTLGVLLLLPGHSFDREFPGQPPSWTDMSSLQLERQFPFLL